MPDFVDDARAKGYSDDEISADLASKRAAAQAAGYDDHAIDDYLTGVKMPRDIPQPFIDRFADGHPASFVVKQTTDAYHAAGGSDVSPEMEQQLRDWGLWNDPAKGQVSPLRFANEAVMRPIMSGVNAVTSLFNAGIAGAGALAAQQVTGEPAPEKTANEMATFGGIAATLLGAAPYAGGITKPHLGPMGEVSDIKVGDLPTHQTVVDGAKALGGPQVPQAARDKLVTLYEGKGLHPAEVADDASRDPTVKQGMLSINNDLPYGVTVEPPAEEAVSRGAAGDYLRAGEPEAVPSQQLPPPARYTTEPDHEVAGQYVAKDEAGKVVAVGDSPDQAVRLAQQRDAEGEGRALVPAAGGGAPPELPPPGEFPPGGVGPRGEPPLLEGPPGPTIEHEGPKAPPMAYGDARSAVLDRLSIGEPDTKRPWSFSRLYTQFIDQLYPLSRAAIRAAGKLDEPLSTANNPEHLARLLSGASGKAEHMLREPESWVRRLFGVEQQKGGTFDFHSYENNGPSLEKILEPIRGQLDDFRAYIASKRAIELDEMRRGVGGNLGPIETGIPLPAAQRVVDEGFEQFAGIHGQLVDYQNRLAQYLRDSGVVSQKGYDAMVAAHENYVPFFRLFDEEEGFRGPGGSLQATNPIHRIKGSDAKIIDPLESIIKNTYLYTQMAERNAVGTTLIDLLEQAGETKVQEVPLWAEWPAVEPYMKELGIKNPDDLMAFVQTAAKTPEGNEIAILRDGKRFTYRVDPELARAFKGLDRDTMNSLTRLLQIPASMLRAGAVLTPEFMARHFVRDYEYAFITAKGLFTPADMARGLWGLISKDADYQRWLKSGGANISIAAIDRDYLQESIADLTKSTGLGLRAQNVIDAMNPQMDFSTADLRKTLLHPLQVGLELAQSATHLGAFKKALREVDLLPGEDYTKPQIQAAGYEARSTSIDPARIGASMKAWNAIVAFGNIALQDSDRVVRAFRDRPMTTALRIAGGIVLPRVLLWAFNHNDPDWQEISQWQKDLFFMIPAWRTEPGPDGQTHKVFFRLPSPWATGLIFGAGTERLLQYFLTDHPASLGSFVRSLIETTGLGTKAGTPTTVSPILDELANQNLFSGRTLIPQAMEKELPEYQYTPYTTETAKRLGQSIAPFAGVYSSPILLENYLRGWTGTLGQYMLEITDSALRKQGVLPDPPRPTPQLADIPFVRAFAIRYPSANTQSIEDFYNDYRDNKMYFTTFMARAKEGDQAAMARIQAAGGPRMFVQLDGINESLTRQNKFIRDIYKNPSMKPEEKRQLIDQSYYEMIDVARQGEAMLKAIPRGSYWANPGATP